MLNGYALQTFVRFACDFAVEDAEIIYIVCLHNTFMFVVIVIPEVGPMSWNAAYVEVSNGTKLGDSIVEKLIELKII